MSFIAVCDQCNRRQEYQPPHSEALRSAIADDWLILAHTKICGSCRDTDEIEYVDGWDIDRVTCELIAHGGADAILGKFLRDKISEYWATVDPVSCGND